MKIVVGSTNPAKVEAVQELLKDYDQFASANISGVKVNSQVADQPIGLDETILGAMNRARSSFIDCDYSIGIEGGLIPVSYDGNDRFMNICVCIFYDGKKFYKGASSMFEIPESVAFHIRQGKNLNDSMNLGGLTKNKEIGKGQGAIGMFTRGRVDRKEYTKQALITALIHLENEDIF